MKATLGDSGTMKHKRGRISERSKKENTEGENSRESLSWGQRGIAEAAGWEETQGGLR